MRFSLLPILISMVPGLLFAAENTVLDSQFNAWIKVTEPQSGLFLIQGFSQASADYEVTYVMTTAKSGQSGTASSSQSGTILLKKEKPYQLSHVQLSGASDDKFTIDLKVFYQEKLVAKAHHFHP